MKLKWVAGRQLMDLAVYLIVRGSIAFLNILPLAVRILIIVTLIRIVTFFIPRYFRIAMRNLQLAFPDKDNAWRENIIQRSYYSLARLIVDAARLQHLDEEWVRTHIEFEALEEYKQLKAETAGKGILIATGHLSSFELLSFGGALLGFPLNFIVRNFKSPLLDRWWISIREKHGNKVIDRSGAYKKIVKSLQAGRDVGILFDQNVTRKHAVFVDFFGKPAATTFALGQAALRTKAVVVVAAIEYLGIEKYRIHWVKLDFSDLYGDANLNRRQKILKITEAVTNAWEQMIRRSPESWFWMHRRWKTEPEEGVELGEQGFYYNV
ncbi:lysophospholipid acyltransferase family protein [Oligoflexia bacterium]|nr:lysophospholipid acyltransferase family protein [Oligoflexia bacterium]